MARDLRLIAGVGIVVALVAGLGAGWWLRGGPERPAAGEGADGAQTDALLARIERLEASQRAAPRDGATSAREAPQAGEALQPTPAQLDAQRRAESEHFRTSLARAYASQPMASGNDGRIAKIDAALVDPTVLDSVALPADEDVSCRAAMCQVRANFAPGADSGDWTNRLLLAMGTALPNASVVAQPMPDGGTEVLVYASGADERPPVEWTQRSPAR